MTIGFPGESDVDFAETLKLVTDVSYASAYSFKYSARPGTPASTANGHVPEAVKSERLATLQQLLDAQQVAFNHATVGRQAPVLFERIGRRPGQMVGRTPWLQAVYVEAGPELLGQIAPVMLVETNAKSMVGMLVNPGSDTTRQIAEQVA
jgi:tRNA-2-methylthio-N6-dimethylallyladenosine synthase